MGCLGLGGRNFVTFIFRHKEIYKYKCRKTHEVIDMCGDKHLSIYAIKIITFEHEYFLHNHLSILTCIANDN